MNLKTCYNGKTALVTGGAMGIGRALCEELADAGATVIVADIEYGIAEEVAEGIRARGGHGKPACLDVRDHDAFSELISGLEREHGSLDFLFNNAAVSITGEVRDFEERHWRTILDTNLHGALTGTLLAYRAMVARGHGHIVNISSLAGLAPFALNIPYTVAKYGLVGLSRSLRFEGANFGVRVTVVCPGIVDTGFYHRTEIVNGDGDFYLARLPKRMTSSQEAARKILKGTARNQALVVFPFHAKFIWLLYRFLPSVMGVINRRLISEFRSIRNEQSGSR